MMWMPRSRGFAGLGCQMSWQSGCWWGNNAMAKISITTGVEIDGFLVGNLIHKGGMARLWEVTRANGC